MRLSLKSSIQKLFHRISTTQKNADDTSIVRGREMTSPNLSNFYHHLLNINIYIILVAALE